MRVSKTVREYIETEVRKRLLPKYQAELDEWERQKKIKDDFHDAIIAVGQQAMLAYIAEHYNEVKDVLDDESFSPDSVSASIKYSVFDVRGNRTWSHCSCAQSRMGQEVRNAVQNIVVELELGGTKKDLERLLNAI